MSSYIKIPGYPSGFVFDPGQVDRIFAVATKTYGWKPQEFRGRFPDFPNVPNNSQCTWILAAELMQAMGRLNNG